MPTTRPRGWWLAVTQALLSWWVEVRGWAAATATPQGAAVALAVVGLLFFLFGLWWFVFDWDQLVALTHNSGRCVPYLTGPKAAFFIVATLTAVLLSLFSIAEAVSLYLHRRRRKQRWSNWLVGLGVSSMLLWSALLYGLAAWCF
ncbi:hypothetical protein [Hydrogenophilus thermoluteolus]|uniref:Uncharacterized protein n=1 Tax=Hydrogenophilus thermoluteolus TaxID=297 RepID=A0A2Z6DVB3_HYDTE|nr:hypothetical protein [Hydrogenophilus thermoluteolus]MBW7656865.1 hypothetical protein [Hydrogenophilus thermoluteolus]BBD76298.1 hypothetical protein HPTL_0028 [Hydrogenophilus thermoluteolus]